MALTPAVAGAADHKEQAEQAFNQATVLFNRGMYLDALKGFRRARKLYPSFKIDLNIATTLDALGRRTEAAVHIEKFLASSAEAPAPIRAEATRWLTALRGKLARVVVTCLVQGAVISVNGKAVGHTPMDLPLYLEPGAYQLSAERQGHKPSSTRLVLRAGDKRAVDLKLARVRAPAQTQPIKALPRTRVPPAVQVDPAAVGRRRSHTYWGYGALGTGAALTVAAAVLVGVAGAQGGEAHDNYLAATSDTDTARYRDDVLDARTKLYVGFALGGVAAAAYGVAIYCLVTRPPAERAPARRSPVAVVPLQGGALLNISGGF